MVPKCEIDEPWYDSCARHVEGSIVRVKVAALRMMSGVSVGVGGVALMSTALWRGLVSLSGVGGALLKGLVPAPTARSATLVAAAVGTFSAASSMQGTRADPCWPMLPHAIAGTASSVQRTQDSPVHISVCEKL